VVPVGLRLDAGSLDGVELALDSQQPLDDAFALLVASFAEVVVADDPFRVGDVKRGPVVVVEGAPDRVVVIERDRVVDRRLRRCPLDAFEIVLERELRRVHPDYDQPVVTEGATTRGCTARYAAS
jgi:hypothetical protein